MADRTRRAYRWLLDHGLIRYRHGKLLSRWTEMRRTGAAAEIERTRLPPYRTFLLAELTAQSTNRQIESWPIDDRMVAEIDATCWQLTGILRELSEEGARPR